MIVCAPYNLESDFMKDLYKKKEWLIEQYETKTTREIAALCDTNHQMILRWMNKFNIDRRNGKDARLRDVINKNVDYSKKYRNKEWLVNEYKTKTVQQIANENGVSKIALLKWFKKFDIDRKSRGEQKSKLKKHNYFNSINSSTKAYWLGFIMADGANSKGSLEIRLSTKDLDHLKQFVNDVEWNGSIITGTAICNISKYNTLHEWCMVNIRSNSMINDLNKYGIINNKTGKESFPDIKEEYYKDFIRGYFDGDGCYTYFYRMNKGKYKTLNSSIKIVCANKEFLIKIKEILIKYANILESKIYIVSSKSIYSLEICSNNSIELFYNYIYPKYCRRYLKRKKDKFIEPLVYIKSHKQKI